MRLRFVSGSDVFEFEADDSSFKEEKTPLINSIYGTDISFGMLLSFSCRYIPDSASSILIDKVSGEGRGKYAVYKDSELLCENALLDITVSGTDVLELILSWKGVL